VIFILLIHTEVGGVWMLDQWDWGDSSVTGFLYIRIKYSCPVWPKVWGQPCSHVSVLWSHVCKLFIDQVCPQIVGVMYVNKVFRLLIIHLPKPGITSAQGSSDLFSFNEGERQFGSWTSPKNAVEHLMKDLINLNTKKQAAACWWIFQTISVSSLRSQRNRIRLLKPTDNLGVTD